MNDKTHKKMSKPIDRYKDYSSLDELYSSPAKRHNNVSNFDNKTLNLLFSIQSDILTYLHNINSNSKRKV